MKKQKILIGWSSRDVTPKQPAVICGQFAIRISKYVNDPLIATALALESEDKQQAIIVSLDALMVFDHMVEKARNIISKSLPSFDPKMLLISATHTHSSTVNAASFRYPEMPAPITNPDDYEKILAQHIAEIAIEAWENRQPGKIGFGWGEAIVGHNRRVAFFDGSSAMYGNTNDKNFSNIEGYLYPGIDMLFTYDLAEKLTGMIVNVTCPSQVTGQSDFISADFWHETRENIRQRHGDHLFILPQCGAEGDQNPKILFNEKAEMRMLQLKYSAKNKAEFGMAKRAEIGKKIACAVDEALPLATKDIREEVAFAHKVTTLNLPKRIVTEEELAEAEKLVKFYTDKLKECDQNHSSSEYSTNFTKASWSQNIIDRYKEQKKSQSLDMEAHIMRIADVAFATNRFEMFLDFGIRIKARAKAVQTFIVNLAGAGSYLPTEKAAKGGGYSACVESNIVSSSAGDVIVEESVKIINEMFSE